MTGKWAIPRQAVVDGKTVFFPRLPATRAYSILSLERKRGVKIVVKSVTYHDCPGVMVWRGN